MELMAEERTCPVEQHHRTGPHFGCCDRRLNQAAAVMVTGDAPFQKVPGLVVALVQGGDPAAT